MKLRVGALVGALLVSLCAPGTAMAQTVVARWHMDEQVGTVMHDAVGDNNGTIHKAALGLSGFQQYAYGFNGSSAYVSVPSSSSLNPGDAALRSSAT
jgi:hypothetical protein